MTLMNLERCAARRSQFMDAIGTDSVAVFVASPERGRSQDTSYKYRPSSDILYLTGFEEPEAVIVIAPGHESGAFTMFVRDRDPERETWDGLRAGPEGAREIFGADAAFPMQALAEELPKLLTFRDNLHYALGHNPEFDQRLIGWVDGLRHRRNAPPAAPRQIVDVRDVVHEMRLVKDETELEVMREAARIASEAHVRAMRVTRAGLREFQVQAEIERHFLFNGAEAPAYTSIVGGGANATILHYVENRDTLNDGDLLLIDAGCEYGYYAADITRTFPVSGKFTAIQRDVYEAVLSCQKACVEAVEPGLAFDQLQHLAVRHLTQGLIDLGALKGSVDENIESEAFRAYYPHKVGHWLGMDVHDVGSYHDVERNWRGLSPGMVLTIEPGLYFPRNDESIPAELRGIGIRIEDDVLVTESGRENLTAGCPKEIVDIENLVGTADLR